MRVFLVPALIENRRIYYPTIVCPGWKGYVVGWSVRARLTVGVVQIQVSATIILSGTTIDPGDFNVARCLGWYGDITGSVPSILLPHKQFRFDDSGPELRVDPVSAGILRVLPVHRHVE
jgi:hypothetical protein